MPLKIFWVTQELLVPSEARGVPHKLVSPSEAWPLWIMWTSQEFGDPYKLVIPQQLMDHSGAWETLRSFVMVVFTRLLDN